MFILINSESKTASIEEPDIFTEFHIESSGNDEDYITAVLGNEAKAAGDSHVWVSIEWISQNVSVNNLSSWSKQFSGMVQYASGKGWVNDSETHLKAHIKTD
ncbi:MAG: hypothetical protein CL470_04265 [Acidimicrobiaceae bacterium]|nr:hypothetical protein [Acidimicrobiaceae bacterium]|tara:strand:- start:39 stop:344 length:306 start_codon:yes stop_codon:yes gene_type:complete